MPDTCLVRKKRTYSSFTKYCCQKGVLPPDIAKNIPRSTKHTWLKQQVAMDESFILADFERKSLEYAEIFTDRNNLVTLSSAHSEVIRLYQKIIDGSGLKKQLLTKSKHLILEAIDRLKSTFSIPELCRYLGISGHQYHA
jgi:hypothetical protein